VNINGAVDIGMVVVFFMAFIEYASQTKRIYHERSSKDFSLLATLLRLGGMIIVLVKIILMKETNIAIGQGILVVLFAVNTIVVFKFHEPKSKS